MLKSMRSSLSSWTVFLILILLILSFVISYIPDAGFVRNEGLDPGVVARVNGQNIDERDFVFRFQSRLASFRNFFQRDIPESLIQGLQVETLDQLIDEKLYARSAKQIGFVPSTHELRESIKKQFSGAGESFDFEQYRKLVQSITGKSTGQFEKGEATRLLAENFVNLINRTEWVSDGDLRDKFKTNNTKASVSFVRIDAQRLKNRLDVSTKPSELEEYYKQHQARYLVPEKTRYEILWVSLEDMLSPDERELEKQFRSSFSDKAKARGARIHAAHILLRSTPDNDTQQKKKISDLRGRVSRGESFEALAAANSEDGTREKGGDLGFFGAGDMVPEFEKTALTLKPGQVSQPVKTSFGYHLIKVYEKIPEGEASVSRLKPELAYLWKKKYFENPKKVEKLAKQAEKTLETIKTESALKKFSQIDSALARSLTTDYLSKEDSIPGLPYPQDSQLIMSSANQLGEGVIGNPVKSLGKAHMYLVKKTGTLPSQTPSLESIKARVQQDLEKEKTAAALKSFAAETIKRASETRATLDQVAKSLGLPVVHSEPFAASTAGKIPGLGAVNSKTMEQIFHALKPAQWLSEPVQIGADTFWVALDKKTEPDWNEFDKQKDELRMFSAEEEARTKLEAWSKHLRSKAKIKQRQV